MDFFDVIALCITWGAGIATAIFVFAAILFLGLLLIFTSMRHFNWYMNASVRNHFLSLNDDEMDKFIKDSRVRLPLEMRKKFAERWVK